MSACNLSSLYLYTFPAFAPSVDASRGRPVRSHVPPARRSGGDVRRLLPTRRIRPCELLLARPTASIARFGPFDRPHLRPPRRQAEPHAAALRTPECSHRWPRVERQPSPLALAVCPASLAPRPARARARLRAGAARPVGSYAWSHRGCHRRTECTRRARPAPHGRRRRRRPSHDAAARLHRSPRRAPAGGRRLGSDV